VTSSRANREHRAEPARTYAQSLDWLARAERVIPLGSQTFSKSRLAWPVGAAPLYADRADGGRLWDLDGNEYVDLVNGLACVSLGYRDRDVDEAVIEQQQRGVTLSLPGRLEAEVAERLVNLIPAAETVRFGKNGSDATTAAIRLARAFTGRDHVLVCGYHGWHDWYIGSTTMNLGVPQSVSALTHRFVFNDLDSASHWFDRLPSQVAAIILEPMAAQLPDDGFVHGLRELADQHGALLIFDETITGLRVSLGGAQELLGVTPDLATFGKGIANGYPLSAVVGRRDVMSLMEQVFVSGTFGGELLSLAAAAATIDKAVRVDLPGVLRAAGQRLSDEFEHQLCESDIADFVFLGGHPSIRYLGFADAPGVPAAALRTLYIQEMAAAGVLTLGSNNVSFAHTGNDVDAVVAAFSRAGNVLAEAVKAGDASPLLRSDVIDPLFRVR